MGWKYYGRWGGPGWSDGHHTVPGERINWEGDYVDELDKRFRDHDHAYDNADKYLAATGDRKGYWRQIIIADKTLIDEIKNLPVGTDLVMDAAGLAALQAFEDKLVYLDIPQYLASDANPGDDWGDDMGDAEQTTSPLVLDLNGDGVQTTRLSKSFTQGVHFNLDAKGLAENTAWVSKDDGLLVRDLNGDNKITNGRELFGNHTLLKNGAQAANGFEALGELDDNGNGVVDANDALFASLKVWKDANSNGVTDADELLTLAQAGIKSFNVTYASSDSTDANGNQHLQQGNFTKTDDSTQSMHDVWFKVDTARTQDTDMLSVSDEIADLPDFANIGNLRSLHQAMVRDETGQLKALVQQYEAQALSANRDALLQDILFHWAGVQDVDPGSRATRMIYGNAIGDARKLEFLEAVLGRGYEGTWCWNERDPNPHGPAAVKLLALYEKVKAYYGIQLDIQTVCRDDLAALQLTWDDNTETFSWDVSLVVSQLQSEYVASNEKAVIHLDRLAAVLKSMGSTGAELLQQLQNHNSSLNDAFSTTLLHMGGQQLIFNGTVGNDNLLGNTEDNYFHGLAGNDTLSGGVGNDTYYFNLADGQDLILDIGADKHDAVRFGAGITPEQIQLSRGTGIHSDDLILEIGNGEHLILQYFFYGDDYIVENFLFNSGQTWNTAYVMSQVIQQGTTDSDRMYGLPSYGNTMNGMAGNDTLYGGDLNDTLTGGTGNDSLEGGTGNDVYVFNQGDGIDTINEFDSAQGNLDTLQLGVGITVANTTVSRVNSDVVLNFGRGDQVTINRYFNGSYYQVEKISFADGTVWGLADLALRQNGTANPDSFTGLSDFANKMFGLAGNDSLTGGNKDDVIDGGLGNDSLIGGIGNDTLIGGIGKDTLTGGDGADRFTFSNLPSLSNSDVLTDFLANQGDKIVFDSTYFTKLFGKKDLTQNFRQFSKASVGGDDYIVYDNANGNLYYDTTGMSNTSAVLIANLQNKPLTMAANQFVVI